MSQNKSLLVYITTGDGFGKQALYAVEFSFMNDTTMSSVQ